MGQKISKRFVMPKLTNAMKSYESEAAKDALNDIAKRQAIAKAKGQKYIDPGAQQGFKRDTWRNDESRPAEAQQREFLKAQQEGAPEEMPKDLIDFLNESGPLERTVDKALTSDKVYESLLEEEEQRRQLEESNKRRRRTMRMMEGGSLDEEEPIDRSDGMTVERTTNFSTAVNKESETDLRLLDDDLFQLLVKLQKNEITVDQFMADRYGADAETTEEDKKGNAKLLQNMVEHMQIPVLMQDYADEEKTLVGARPDRVEILKLSNIRMAPDYVRLGIECEDLHEQLQSSFKTISQTTKVQSQNS